MPAQTEESLRDYVGHPKQPVPQPMLAKWLFVHTSYCVCMFYVGMFFVYFTHMHIP
jgi:hypothetical protein